LDFGGADVSFLNRYSVRPPGPTTTVPILVFTTDNRTGGPPGLPRGAAGVVLGGVLLADAPPSAAAGGGDALPRTGGTGFIVADAMTNTAVAVAQTTGTSRDGFDTECLSQNPGEPNSANV
jgi:hypothetical protein